MDIRQAIPDDAEALGKLHVDSWRVAYRGLVPDAFLEALSYEVWSQRFREWLTAQTLETYLSEEDGSLLGYLIIGACRDEDVDPVITGEIWGIYLAPQHWRQGTGRRLCKYGERLLSGRGYQIATLWVFAGNEQARRFYEAMGYTTDGASKVLNPGAPLEAIRYRKSLVEV